MKPEIGRYYILNANAEHYTFPRGEPERFRRLAWKQERNWWDWLIGAIGIVGLLAFLLFFRVAPVLA
jgi:hypothetical protein